MKRLMVFFALLLFVTPVQAKNNKHEERESETPLVRDVFEKPFAFLPPPPLPGVSKESQQEVIDRYYRNTEKEREQYQHHGDDDQGNYSKGKGKNKKHLPPGLKKKEARGKELPRGWRKKIARDHVLDRDLRGHCQELPQELRRELPRPDRGTKFLRLEDTIIRVVESTFEIVDVFNYGN